MAGEVQRPQRGGGTRELILETAERLFAEHGIHAVSNRQISETAGQGNSAAVGYHFGSKAELVRAIVRRHTDEMERLRLDMVAEVVGSTDLRDWVSCRVRPFTVHLAALGHPTWCARFLAQVAGDPALHAFAAEDAATSTSLRLFVASLNRCLPDLSAAVRAERSVMARHLIAQMCAERERALAQGITTIQDTWQDLATGLTDAIVGMWQAPVTHRA